MVVQVTINHRFINLVGTLCIRETRKKIVNVTPTEMSLHRDRGFFHFVGSEAVIVISKLSSHYLHEIIKQDNYLSRKIAIIIFN